MKPLIAATLVCSTGLVWAEDASCFAKFFTGFPTFKTSVAEVEWAAATNSARVLWVYKVVPQKFSDAALSNLMEIGGFRPENRKEDTTLSDPSTTRISFSDQKRLRALTILPEYGFLHYSDQNATKGSIQDVPKLEEAKVMALRLFKRIGLPESELVRKPDGTLLTFEETKEHTHFDRATAKSVTETSGQGVHFVRQIDGVPIAGIGTGGGFFVMFGSHGSVADLQVVWRNLNRFQPVELASPNSVCRWVKDGRAVLTHRDITGPDGPNALSLRQSADKLTVTRVSLLYTSERGTERQDFICPFAKLEGMAESQGTNYPIQLYCPIIAGPAK